MHQKSKDIVRTLWHGGSLTVYEKLSLLSFLKCGHDVELYTYEHIEVPSGVRLCDANSILPFSEVFSYSRGRERGSFAAFSNLFRYKLLYEKGGIWADLDVLCLRSLHELPDACVGKVGENRLNCAILKFPAGHIVCAELFRRAKALGKSINMGSAGPSLVTEVIARMVNPCVILPISAFYPIHWKDAWKLIDPDEVENCEVQTQSSYCVHWWNAALTLHIGLPKNALPPIGSFLYKHAEKIFSNSDLKTWPHESVKIWIRNYKLGESFKEKEIWLKRPVTYLLKSDLKTIRKDLNLIASSVIRKII